jgi:hypothetical protein
MKATSPRNDHAQAPADPERGPAARVSSLVPEVSVPSGPGARHGILVAVCLVPLRLTPLAVRLVALLWPLILGQMSVAGDLATRKEGPPSDSPVQTVSTGRGQSGSPVSVARFGIGSKLRPHKRSHAFPKITCDDDPNDDEASDDPNDDVVWDDRNDRDDTGMPVIGCLQEMVRNLPPPEVESVPDSTAPPSSPLLTTQRLRC